VAVSLSRVRRSVLAVALLGAACGSPDPGSEPVGVGSAAILSGSLSPPSQNFAVAVNSPMGEACTGVLVAPDIVLIAQHCVTVGGIEAGTNDIADCQLSSTPLDLSQVPTITVGPSVVSPIDIVAVTKIFVNEGNTDCFRDIAALGLERPVTSVQLMPLLLEGSVPQGTEITVVGYGNTSMTTAPSVRQQASGKILISLVGGAAPAPDKVNVPIPQHWLAASIEECYGDSGAPQGAVIGISDQIVSDKTTDGTTPCADSIALASPISSVAPFITQVFQAMGRMPWSYPRPAPPADVGGVCSQSNECNSDYCVLLSGSQGVCSSVCKKASDCPSPTTCTTSGTGDISICLAPQAAPQPRGCSISTTSRTEAPGFAAVACALTWLGAIRRRNR